MLNFDLYKLHWAFEWVDNYYNGWGSYTCPEEPHSHIDNTKHSVNYGNYYPRGHAKEKQQIIIKRAWKAR